MVHNEWFDSIAVELVASLICAIIIGIISRFGFGTKQSIIIFVRITAFALVTLVFVGVLFLGDLIPRGTFNLGTNYLDPIIRILLFACVDGIAYVKIFHSSRSGSSGSRQTAGKASSRSRGRSSSRSGSTTQSSSKSGGKGNSRSSGKTGKAAPKRKTSSRAKSTRSSK